MFYSIRKSQSNSNTRHNGPLLPIEEVCCRFLTSGTYYAKGKQPLDHKAKGFYKIRQSIDIFHFKLEKISKPLIFINSHTK